MRETKSSISSKGRQSEERGVALIIALLALTVLTGIGFAIMVSSSTESLINAGFRRAGMAHFAAVGGLEEMRGRMGPDAAPLTNNLSSIKIPCSDATTCPPLFNPATRAYNLGLGYYIRLNGTMDPSSMSCKYLNTGDCYDPSAPGTPIYFTSAQPGTPMPYVWVKVTLATQRKLKRNMVTPCNPSDPGDANYCDPATLDDTRIICRNGGNLIVAEAANPLPANSVCGDPINPIFIYTALSIQPGRALRVVRELAAYGKIPNLPGGLVLDGCPATFPPPTSHPFMISGDDVGSFNTDAHAVTTRCPGDAVTIQNLISDGNSCNPVGVAMAGCQRGPNHNGDYPGVGNNNCNNPNCNNTNNSADIFDGSGTLGANDYFKDCAGVLAFVAYVEGAADYTYPAGTTSLPYAGNGSNNNPDLWDRVVNVVKGDADLSQADFSCGTNCPGAGIILVEGDLRVTGYPSYNGAILVIGTGQMTVQGGGNGTINGGILLANTTTCSTTGMLGPVSFNNPGGGNFQLNYDSDAIKPKDGLLPVQRLSLNY